MKRLFRIGSGLFIYSLMPILSWIVLSYTLGDTRISNVYSLTYAMQYVWMILKSFFATSANIRKHKEQQPNATWNGIFWGTIFSAIIFAIPLIFVDNYISFFGQDAQLYRIYAIYAIAQLFIQTLFSFIIEKLFFEDKEKIANIHLFAFNMLNFVLVVVLTLLIENKLLAFIITLAILFIYVLALYIWQFEKFKIDFSFFKNFKYESASIVSAIFMTLIYLFGFQNVFSAGEEYLVALNLVALCTDAQLDCLDAISTVAKVDISKNRYNYKRELKNSYFFTLIVIASSLVMVSALIFLFNVSWTLVLIYMAFQAFAFLTIPISYMLSAFTQLEYSPVLNTVISLSTKAVRVLLSVVIISPFCTNIGQVVEGSLLLVALLIIRFTKYKVSDGKLVVKTAKNSSDAVLGGDDGDS